MNGCTAKIKTDQLDRDCHLLSWSVSQSYVQRNYLAPLKISKDQNTTKRYFLFESIEKEYFQYVVTMKFKMALTKWIKVFIGIVRDKDFGRSIFYWLKTVSQKMFKLSSIAYILQLDLTN